MYLARPRCSELPEAPVADKEPRPTAVIPWAVETAEADGQPTAQKEGTCQPVCQEQFSLHISLQLEHPVKKKIMILKWSCQQASRFTIVDS